MKKSNRCPKCEGTDIAHADTVADKNAIGGPSNMSLGVGIKRKGLLAKEVPWGQLEAFACKGCGYTELYVTDLASLAD